MVRPSDLFWPPAPRVPSFVALLGVATLWTVCLSGAAATAAPVPVRSADDGAAGPEDATTGRERVGFGVERGLAEVPGPPRGGGAPRPYPALVPAASAAGAPDAAQPRAEAELFLVQRQAYGYWTHYLLQAADGAPLGVVERRHWRQPWRRRFESTDVNGVPQAHATQPWLSVGNALPWHAVLRLEGADGAPLGRVQGRLWTLRAAAYDFFDPRGESVAQAVVDDCGQGVLVYAPKGRRIVATLLREQQATLGSDRWSVRVEPDAPLAPAAWPLIAAFFADVWSSVARGCAEG